MNNAYFILINAGIVINLIATALNVNNKNYGMATLNFGCFLYCLSQLKG